MRRITPEEVIAAYEKTGLTPARGLLRGWVAPGKTVATMCNFDPDTNKRSACALGVLCSDEVFNGSASVFKSMELTKSYSNGFTDGFDGVRSLVEREGENLQGFLDGREVAHHVFKEE